MAHTQGRLKYCGCGKCGFIYAPDADVQVAEASCEDDPDLRAEGVPSVSAETRAANAAELVRRWNAFEDGGAVALAIEALRGFVGHWGAPSEADFDAAYSALAALTEEAGK